VYAPSVAASERSASLNISSRSPFVPCFASLLPKSHTSGSVVGSTDHSQMLPMAEGSPPITQLGTVALIGSAFGRTFLLVMVLFFGGISPRGCSVRENALFGIGNCR
jgi:hypothetical protein